MCSPQTITAEQTKMHGEKWKNFDSSRFIAQAIQNNPESAEVRHEQIEEAVEISAYYDRNLQNLIVIQTS